MTEIEIGRLHVSTTDVKPIDIDWRDEARRRSDYTADEEAWSYWETFTAEVDDAAGDTQEFTLIDHDGRVEGIVVDGHVYDRWDDIADLVLDGDEDALPLTEEMLDELMALEPYNQGSEGPMMNYWYPIEEDDREYSSFDPIESARKLEHSNLCLVLVDGKYGVALTGGGMDFSWEICDAFIRLGKCPPLHFLDLPHMADTWRDMHERVYQGAQRTLEFTVNHANRIKERLDDYRAKQTGGDA